MHIHKITTEVSFIRNCLHIIIDSYLITVYLLFNTMTCGQGGRVTITYYNSSDITERSHNSSHFRVLEKKEFAHHNLIAT